MRIVRLFGLVLSILAAVLLLATPAGAQPPSKLTDHITDTTGALTNSDRAAVSSAVDRLYRDKHIQLWVVYVDNFSRFKPENWADRTREATSMGGHDVLLAVATNTKLYAFSAPGFPTDEVTNLQNTQIAPAVAAKNWSGAAVAAADGLNKTTATSSKRTWLLIAIGVAAVVLVVVLFLLYRRHRRRRAARQIEAGSGQVNVEGPVNSAAGALSTADARMRQISDYTTKYRQIVGADARARLEEAKRHLSAAHATAATNERDAVAHANQASALAAQAQTLANADVQAAQRARGSRGASSR
ncbi:MULTISPECIES: YgcG family protein [unclassified Mycobacterium]|uniref:TPM domain-containing protein n=1 Tax=unclassified Mycobacterium TaxID=2642494 RepID=UPI002741C51C|nr:MULTISPECIES: TPM domain-containing protein [unclassified Mycobacterium]MDP7701139.1 TPM domain-containing protein [Mycobacterium sp. TY815]MDP7724001.1 TPM domain-containing protein [Mycobacterium sp. TY814]